jgi:hypothetical protein
MRRIKGGGQRWHRDCGGGKPSNWRLAAADTVIKDDD